MKFVAKICESFVAEFISLDMLPNQDPSQYVNQKGLYTQHYRIKMFHEILTAAYRNSKDGEMEVQKVVDWESAFDHPGHRLGILSFLKIGQNKPVD